MDIVFGLVLIVFFLAAVCTRYGLAVGAHTAWLTWFLMAVVYPVTWPIAKVLSWVVGDQEGLIYRRAELKELMRLHSCQEMGDLDVGEVAIIQSVLDLKDKRARDVCCAHMLWASKFIKAY